MSTSYISANRVTPEPQDTDSLMASTHMELKENPEYVPVEENHDLSPTFKNWQDVEVIGANSKFVISVLSKNNMMVDIWCIMVDVFVEVLI